MIMVAHHYAGVYPKTGPRAGFARCRQQSLPVPVILENLLPVTATGHHVIPRAETPTLKPNMSLFKVPLHIGLMAHVRHPGEDAAIEVVQRGRQLGWSPGE